MNAWNSPLDLDDTSGPVFLGAVDPQGVCNHISLRVPAWHTNQPTDLDVGMVVLN